MQISLSRHQASVGNVTQHVVTLTEKDYYLMYDVKVRAYNKMGDGPESKVASIYSSEGRTSVFFSLLAMT